MFIMKMMVLILDFVLLLLMREDLIVGLVEFKWVREEVWSLGWLGVLIRRNFLVVVFVLLRLVL